MLLFFCSFLRIPFTRNHNVSVFSKRFRTCHKVMTKRPSNNLFSIYYNKKSNYLETKQIKQNENNWRKNGTNFHLSRLDLLCRLLQDLSNQDLLDSKPEIMTLSKNNATNFKWWLKKNHNSILTVWMLIMFDFDFKVSVSRSNCCFQSESNVSSCHGHGYKIKNIN